MKSYKSLWIVFILIMIGSFAVLGYYGTEIYQKMPPIPKQVITENNKIVFSKEDIQDGQNVWQSIGGHELGSIWGHGSYTAPDWTADWLHREAKFIANELALEEYQKNFENINDEEKAFVKARLQKILRTNTYDPDQGSIVIPKVRFQAIQKVTDYYSSLFLDDPKLAQEREAYAMPAMTVKDKERMDKLNAFFFWASWATITNRPDSNITYTNNWPPDKLVGNEATPSLLIWTGFSVILLLAGIALLAAYYAKNREEELDKENLPTKDPLMDHKPTESMKATRKYFWIVTALFILQVLLGAIVAHYGVEGLSFYGVEISSWLPYSVARTWHIQLALFWIATSWLATGLFISPAISEQEPKHQKFGVDFLFGALVLIVVGSLAGEWLAIKQKLDFVTNFWFGHQGYEYVDLGRFWQIFLLVGLILWLVLMIRALIPAFKKDTKNKPLLMMFTIASTAIALFYSAGLMWDQHSNLVMAEYWRWWVVHLWVEGFFEVFATVVIAFFFVRMQLINTKLATAAVLFSTNIFLLGGIIGTFHHLYFAGTPTAILALGATFSALEVVPLILISFEAYHNLRLSRATEWIKAYKWPIYCFIAVAFWNLVGAGIFGFLINPPIALYYMQGLNTTPVHGHTALFGVYGMLGIGLMLFVLKSLKPKNLWNENVLAFSFWAINIGLALMVLLSVLPLGLIQTWASFEHGFWYARSMEFMQEPLLDKIRWMRVVGDTIFAIGAVGLGYFVLGLETGWSIKKRE